MTKDDLAEEMLASVKTKINLPSLQLEAHKQIEYKSSLPEVAIKSIFLSCISQTDILTIVFIGVVKTIFSFHIPSFTFTEQGRVRQIFNVRLLICFFAFNNICFIENFI